MFLSEMQIFSSDLPHSMSLFEGEYCHELNAGENVVGSDIAMTSSKAWGGVCVMWKRSLDKFITVYPVNSPSFLPVVYSPPGTHVTVHIALYLPTSGKEEEFIEAVSELDDVIEELTKKYDDCLVFLRGDGNANPNNLDRYGVFTNFLQKHNLVNVHIGHKTYHHFLGGGAFDSNIDIILQPRDAPFDEVVTNIFCGHEYPEIDSHHDIIISSVSLPVTGQVPPEDDTSQAPRAHFPRCKILWSDEGIVKYRDMVTTKLAECRTRWLNPTSVTSLAILFHTTNNILSKSAKTTNKFIDISKQFRPKSEKKPKEVKESEKLLKKVQIEIKSGRTCQSQSIKAVRNMHRSIVRRIRVKKQIRQDAKLFSVLSANPSEAFRSIKSARTKNISGSVPYITVGEKKYVGSKVVVGLYKSISKLKRIDQQFLETSPYHASLMDDYKNIRFLCSRKVSLPRVSLSESSSILKRLKSGVNDLYSLTPNHFLYAGPAGLVHFNLLLNTFIIDVNSCSIEELNRVYALLLHKGHNKDRTVDTSYRTISTCPLLAKALDMVIRDLSVEYWDSNQAATQYQGTGSTHELASLLITEAIQISKYCNKEPLFLLFLDAKSAFDAVIVPYLIRNLYLTGMHDQGVLFMDTRLRNRTTVLEFDKTMVGPIIDEKGLEQGGLSSSDCYKVYNNECLDLLQSSGLGVKMPGDLVLSCVGQADDTVLLANDIWKLYHLLQLCLEYCQKHCVQLSPTKTKLVMVTADKAPSWIPYNPVRVNGTSIELSDQAEHVGVLRSVKGNMPNILQRISAFKGALGAIMSCGLARGRRTNPVVSMKILALYGTPVLMSGLSSLVLSRKEVSCIDQQYKRTLQNILKLSTTSPSCLVSFIAGKLPGTAILHLRQLSLFGMICRLEGDPLHRLAVQVLLTSVCKYSWFVQIRELLLLYQLPHPLHLLHSPPSKDQFKKLTKAHVLSYWETKLRAEADLLPSLVYFHPKFMSLTAPHRLWTTAGKNTYEVAKARVQLLFLSSQYPCAKHVRHWSKENPLGLCSYGPCQESLEVESPEHILLHCPSYTEIRLQSIMNCFNVTDPISHSLVSTILGSSTNQTIMQFLLDCSVIPDVIRAAQCFGDHIYNDLFYLSRTWCYVIHRERLKRLCKWNFQ